MQTKMNHANVIPQALLWRKEHNIESHQLANIIDLMVASNKFYCTKYLLSALKTSIIEQKNCLPQHRRGNSRYHYYLQNQFEHKLGISELDMGWMVPPAKTF